MLTFYLTADGEDFCSNDYMNGILDPVVTKEMSKAGKLEFTILPTSTHYDLLKRMKTIICAYYYDELIFRGRVLTITTSMDLQRKVTCEGDLAFFMDSVDYPRYNDKDDVEDDGWKYGFTLRDFIGSLIAGHNDFFKDEPEKQFSVGTIGVLNRTPTATKDEDKLDSDPHKRSYHSHSDLVQMADYLVDELVDKYGGYLQTRTVSGEHYLDFLDISDADAEHDILFGVNLLDLSIESASDNPYSGVVPIGKDGLKVSDVKVTHSDGSVSYEPYVCEDSAAVKLLGRIIKPLDFSEIDNKDQLKKAAENYMKRFPPLLADTIEVHALDIQLLDDTADPNAFVKIGDRVQVTCESHGIDIVLNCLSATYDLQNPEKNGYKLGQYIPESEEAARAAYTTKLNISYKKMKKKSSDYYTVGDSDTGSTAIIT